MALRQSFPGLEPDAVTSVEDEDVGGKYKESQNSADSNSVALIYSGFKNAALSTGNKIPLHYIDPLVIPLDDSFYFHVQ